MGKLIRLAIILSIFWGGYKLYLKYEHKIFERPRVEAEIDFTDIKHDVVSNFRGKYDKFIFTATNRTGKTISNANIRFYLKKRDEVVAQSVTYLQECPNDESKRLKAIFRDAPEFDEYDIDIESVKYQNQKDWSWREMF